jgi:hypothetical protein
MEFFKGFLVAMLITTAILFNIVLLWMEWHG